MRRKERLKKYGMTIPEYEALLLKQAGVCAICGGCDKAKRLAIDHDHETGAIRGLLCFDCNTGIGKFQGSPRLLGKAATYLLQTLH